AQAASAAPSTITRGSLEHDAWTVSRLLDQKIAPVILVGLRQANAKNPDGSIRTDVKNPYGYLRRAVGTTDDGGQLVVMTKPASLIDANEELQRLGLMTVENDTRQPDGDDDDDGGSDGWHWQRTYPFTLTDIDLNQTLYHQDIGAGIGSVD